jgi:hypothetical protein
MRLGHSEFYRGAGRAGDLLPKPESQPTVRSKRAARGENNSCLRPRKPIASPQSRRQHAIHQQLRKSKGLTW